MVQITSPLILLGELPEDVRLFDQMASGKDAKRVHFNENKYSDLEVVEAIVDGMSFVLTRLTAKETRESLDLNALNKIFCKDLSGSLTGIAISLGENLSGGKHIAPVNRTLLELGYLLGKEMLAQAVIWKPGNQLVGFEYFSEATTQYVNGGPFPALVQVGIVDDEHGGYHTTGLDYFAGQEVVLTTPNEYPPNEAMKRLIRVIHDIATNGKIDQSTESDGLAQGERIKFTPDDQARVVCVAIK